MAAIRKISLFQIVFTSVGVLLVIVGFPVSSHQSSSATHAYLAVCVSGVLIILLGFTHALLWYPLSPILGAVTAFFSMPFLTGLGRILYSSGNSITNGSTQSVETKDDTLSHNLEFTGAMISTFFWTTVMIAWQFYDTELLRGNGHATLRGIARKLILLFIILTGIGWFLVVVGFGVASAKDEPSAAAPTAYPYWAVSISGPFTFVFAIAHAVLGKEPYAAILGVITMCLNTVFVTGLGMIIWSTDFELAVTVKLSKLAFAGASFSTFFWTPVMILWHFFDYEVKKQEQYLALY